MNRFLIFLFLICPYLLWSDTSFCIVFVHIGKQLPPHLEVALTQARTFNPKCPIILIANEDALKDTYIRSDILSISCESLPLTQEHLFFQNKTKLNDQCFGGYQRYTSERFMYLYDFMVFHGIDHVFHIENDVMLYVDLEKLLPIFLKHYHGIATTFESERKGIAGFVFINNASAMQKLAKYFVQTSPKAMNDMMILGAFWKQYKDVIDCLPMIMPSYFISDYQKLGNDLLKRKLQHTKHIAEFESIFDGAAIGVFLDGLNSTTAHFPPGYLMKALFNPSLITYTWKKDEYGRKVPYAQYGNEIYRINNLHIASKRLEGFKG